MNAMEWMKRVGCWRGLAGCLLLSALVGCKRQSDQVYYVPKEPAPSQTATPAADETAANSAGLAPNQAALPKMQWTLPKGWQEKAPSQMRVASFTASGPNGQTADVSVIPLPFVGRERELVNMWRQQLDLPPLANPDTTNQPEAVTVGTDPGKLYDLASQKPMIDGKFRARILVAMVTRGSMSWFFKMSGEDPFVASQKPTFIKFLKSVSFQPQPAGFTHPLGMDATPAGNSANSETAEKPVWTVPAGWQAVPPAQFLEAEYAITNTDGARADADAAVLNGDGGGVLANVNRWRGQLGLDPVTEAQLPSATTDLKVPGGQATVVDLTGKDPQTGKGVRLIGVILPQAGRTWFYRLRGDRQLVGQQKAAFLQFIQSAKYDHAP